MSNTWNEPGPDSNYWRNRAWDAFEDYAMDEGIEVTPENFDIWCEDEAARAEDRAEELAERIRNEGRGYY